VSAHVGEWVVCMLPGLGMISSVISPAVPKACYTGCTHHMAGVPCCLQGTASKVVRIGSAGFKAKYIGLAGLGQAAKVGASADWGASCYQVRRWRAGV
jgi:hypothetical protein